MMPKNNFRSNAALNHNIKVIFILKICVCIILISGKGKSSRVRVAKSLSEENRKQRKAKHAKLMQNKRAGLTTAQKQQAKELDKERKAQMRASMTEEEKSKQREKDRLRKVKKFASLTDKEKSEVRKKDRLRKAAKKDPAPKDWRTLPRKWTKPDKPYTFPDEEEKNRLYQERRRQGRTEAEVEFEQIQNLLIKRCTRAERSEEEKKEEDAKAKRGMQLLPFQPLKSRRKSKGQREEYIWWKYWKKGDEQKELIRAKLPKFGEQFDMWDSKSQNPYKLDEEKEEKWNALSHQEKLSEKNKLRRKWVNEQLQQPIEMPEMEPCEYERIREQIIAEQNVEFEKYMMELNVHDSIN